MRHANDDFRKEYNLLDNLCKRLSGDPKCKSGIALLIKWAESKGKYAVANQLDQLRQLKNITVSHSTLPGESVSIPWNYVSLLKKWRTEIESYMKQFREDFSHFVSYENAGHQKKNAQYRSDDKVKRTVWTTPYGYPDPLDYGDKNPVSSYWFLNVPNDEVGIVDLKDHLQILDEISDYEGFRASYHNVFSETYRLFGAVYERTGRVRGLIPNLRNYLDENSWIYMITAKPPIFYQDCYDGNIADLYGDIELFACFNSFGDVPASCIFGLNSPSEGFIDCFGLYYIEDYEWKGRKEFYIRKKMDGRKINLGCSRRIIK